MKIKEIYIFLPGVNIREWYLYVQVRFELIQRSEISYLIVHLHEKARKGANFDMTIKQERNKVMIRHEKMHI